MDNFRKSKTPKKIRGTIDGMIGSGTSRPRRDSLLLDSTPHKDKKTTLKASGAVTDFKQSDGFHPNRAPAIKTTGRQPQRRNDGSIHLQLPPEDADRSKRNQGKLPRSYRKIAFRGFTLFFLTTLVFGGYLFGKGYLKARQVFKGGGSAVALGENVDPSQLKGEGDGRVNILMLGKGGEGHEAPDLTDTILIASINPVQKEAALLSVPRDLYVKTDEQGSMKINAVYANAKNYVLNNTGYNDPNREQKAEEEGFKAIENTIEETMGIPVHYHVMVDFEGFKKAIDTVGGIDVNAPSEVYERMWLGFPYVLNVQPGWQSFDGTRALAYARSRYTSPRGDFDRSERQRAILVALKDKILTLGTLGNPLKMSQLLGDFGDHVYTNLTVDEMMRLYEIGQTIDSSKISSVGLADPPNDFVVTDNIRGQSVVVPKAGLYNYKAIQNFIRNKLKDGYLADENATVLVLNGTYTPGLAGRTAEELGSYGYSLSPVADTPTKGYQETVIVDLRNGEKKYTKRYLEQRFGTMSVPNLPDSAITSGMADFVIILGENEVSRLEN